MKTNTELRIDRQLATMTTAEKKKLLDTVIGKVQPGYKPDPEADERYLRDIIASQLKEDDALEASGIAALERRVAALERRKPSFGKAQIDSLMQGIGEAMADFVPEALTKFAQARCLMSFAGVWDPDREYRRGEVVTDAGSLWVTIDQVKGSRPGKSADYKLIAKAGST